MANTFICPMCGKETQQAVTGNKQFCTECSRRRNAENTKRWFQEQREKNGGKYPVNSPKPKTVEQTDAQKAHDEEIDKRSRKQIKLQCQFCKYQLKSGSNNESECIGCDYISWKGHSTDKGNGPGDCRSFEPLTKKTKAERIARRKRAITISEANNAKNTGEKMREVNQL